MDACVGNCGPVITVRGYLYESQLAAMVEFDSWHAWRLVRVSHWSGRGRC